MPRFSPRLIAIFFTVWLAGLAACENHGSTIAGNPNLNGGQPVVTLGELTDSKVMVTIPEEAFQSTTVAQGTVTIEDHLEASTIDIRRNGASYFSGLAAADYFVDSQDAVIFYLSSLADGDEMAFDVKWDDVEITYTGTVSDEEETYAINEEGTIESANIIEPAVAIINLAATDGRMSDSYTNNTDYSDIDENFSDLTRRVIRMLVATAPRQAESGSTIVDYESDCTEDGGIQVQGPVTHTFTDTTLDMHADVTVSLNGCEQEIEVDVADGDCTYTQIIDGALSLVLDWHYDAGEEDGTGEATLVSDDPLSLTSEGAVYALELDLTSTDGIDFMQPETTTGLISLGGLVYDIAILHDLTADSSTDDFCPGDSASSEESTDTADPETLPTMGGSFLRAICRDAS